MNKDWKVDAVKAVAFAAAVVAIVAVVSLAIHWDREARKERPVTITQEDARNPKMVEEQLRVTPIESRVITREIQRSSDTPPAVTYYVQAPTVQDAADRTATAIREKDKALPSAVTAKSDRTAIVSNEDRQQVDVYKITLRRAHKIKTGMTYVNDKAYLSAGYQAGRWEGLVHFDTRTMEPKGATISYTLLEW